MQSVFLSPSVKRMRAHAPSCIAPSGGEEEEEAAYTFGWIIEPLVKRSYWPWKEGKWNQNIGSIVV